jgi:aspartate racemase
MSVDTTYKDKNILGVLGGMGPLASAEFVKTVYESSTGQREQQSPIVLLYSDPTFPDRTEAFLSGEEQELLSSLIEALDRLTEMGASKIVICCVTIHHLLPKLPPRLREVVVSLPDVVVEHMYRRQTRQLLVCSTGTRELRIFQRHPEWRRVGPYATFPDEPDQQRFHELIYGIKLNRNPAEFASFLQSRLTKYRVDSFVAGCTECHLLAKHALRSGIIERANCLDPLLLLAEEAWNPRLYEQRRYQATI